MSVRTVNPYTPEEGFVPAFLAGREEMLGRARSYLENVQNRYPQQPVIYFGLRGVGKTVLLNAIEEAADNRDMLYHHIEASEDGHFSARLIGALVRFTSSLSAHAAAKELSQRVLSMLKAFRVTYNMIENSVEVGVDTSMMETTGIYADDLTEIFSTLGKAASRAGQSVCVFVDEMQCLTEEELAGLASAMHRCNQLRLPVILFGAGLPKIRKAVGEARSYAERLFKFEEVSALDDVGTADAITEPAKDLGVSYTADAIREITAVTEGYPYFIQAFCQTIWDRSEGPEITLEDVRSSQDAFFAELDRGFFQVRYNRCSHMEQSFMTAMVKCGELPCTISNVAAIMNRKVKSISPFRGKLISKGLIYATGHAEIDFTVPQFDGFIRRINPDLQL